MNCVSSSGMSIMSPAIAGAGMNDLDAGVMVG